MVFSGFNLQGHTNYISGLFLKKFSNYCKKHLSLFSENPVILIVDNDADNLMLTEQIVNLLGYRAITARDGETALKMIEQYRPVLVLLEIMIPEIDGINIANYLGQQNNFVPVIFLTSLPYNILPEEAMNVGCNGYIEKPFQIEELETVIEEVMCLTSTIVKDENILSV